jgi:Putative adhesin
MNRGLKVAISQALSLSLSLSLVAVSLVLVFSSAAVASDHQSSMTEEFHKVYPLSAQGRVEIRNINGSVHIVGWDRNEVKVDAVKSAWSKERLDEATIEVSATQDEFSIHTEYPEHGHNQTFNYNSDDEKNNPASVEYTISVPRQARLEKINLVNGRLDVQDVTGEIRASCVNGRIQARNLQGPFSLQTVNGELEANVAQLSPSIMKLSSVNGKLRVTLPSDAQAEVDASTVSGRISDDFGLAVTRHQYVGQTLHGQLGAGGTKLNLSNVNGPIEINHASDNRPLSPARSLSEQEEHGKINHDAKEDDDNDNDDET